MLYFIPFSNALPEAATTSLQVAYVETGQLLIQTLHPPVKYTQNIHLSVSSSPTPSETS